MLKIMIADDERIIREGLSKAVDWQKMGLEVVGTAADGEQALSLATRTRPDICLVDIRMPFVSGLEFVERMQKIKEDMKFIIITGHDEFDYAQRAIKLKVFDYLLKPINVQELEAVLKNAIQSIDEKAVNRRRINVMEEQLRQTLPDIRRKFIVDCLEGRYSPFDTEHFERLFGIRFDDRIGVLLVRIGNCIYVGDEYERPDYSSFTHSLKCCISETVGNTHNILLSFLNDIDGFLILVAELGDVGLSQRLADIEKDVLERISYRITVFYGETDEGIHTIDSVYSSLVQQVKSADKMLPFIRTIKKFIDDHYMDKKLTLGRIARKFNVSTGHISRLFKKEIGISYSDYVQDKRIKKAIELLEDSEKKIYEIAETVGYGSQHYFCSTFKRITGYAPSDYRRRQIR